MALITYKKLQKLFVVWKKIRYSLKVTFETIWLGGLEPRPMHQKVAVSIPGQGPYFGFGFNPQSGPIQEAANQCFSHIDVSLYLPLLPPFSRINKHILG